MYYLNTYCKVHFVRIPVGKESRKILIFLSPSIYQHYMLRHDAQSNIAAIRKGVDFQTLQYLMGHSDNSVIPENTLVHSRVWVRRLFCFWWAVGIW